MRRGKLIVFEGIDGSGKTYASQRLAEFIEAHWTCEPTQGYFGELFKEAVSEGGDFETVMELITQDREEHVNEMVDIMDSGQHVVCDRFYLSTCVYQSDGTHKQMAEIYHQQSAMFGEPALRIYVGTPIHTCLDRVTSRGEEYSLDDLYNLSLRYDQALQLCPVNTLGCVSGDVNPLVYLPILAQRIDSFNQGGSRP